jgi:hypothetical protein
LAAAARSLVCCCGSFGRSASEAGFVGFGLSALSLSPPPRLVAANTIAPIAAIASSVPNASCRRLRRPAARASASSRASRSCRRRSFSSWRWATGSAG